MQKNKFQKVPFFFLISCLYSLSGFSQVNDSTSIKKVIINNVCLCQTTIPDLKKTNPDLRDTVVEEMDLASNCNGIDSRFITGKGYSTAKSPGMIFQQDRSSDRISKIRLTKQFAGKLPHGKFINLGNLKLKELLLLYPQFKDQWGSRDCSNYWRFSNDTMAFYFKIDSTKKPQFPIDKMYYMDKPVEAVDITLSCYGVQRAYSPRTINDDIVEHVAPSEPVYFMDSVRVTGADLSKYDSKDIATVSIYKGASAIIKFGPEAEYGLIFIETKKFDIHRYQTYFKSKSPDYTKLISNPANVSKIQYILNKKILKTDYEGNLAAINDKIFKELIIIDKKQLIKDYGITNKNYGVIITADIPVNSYNKDKEKNTH
jgi:hypothetical protein